MSSGRPVGARLRLQAAALEAADNPIIISRRDGTIVWVNKAFEQLSGYTRGEALGQSTSLLKSGQHSASFYKNIWETILSGQRWRGELVNRRKNGSFYHEEMTVTPVKNGTGDITHFIAIKLDISERKQAEEQIRRQALADPLTGLANYRCLLDALESASTIGSPVCCPAFPGFFNADQSFAPKRIGKLGRGRCWLSVR
jgi:two-component system cell cycle response regulator